jgi:hypothetical protein
MPGCAHRVTPADATLREFLRASILFKSPRTGALSGLVDFFVKSCIQWAALRVDNWGQWPLTGHCMRQPRGPLNHRPGHGRSSTWTI